MIMPMPAFLLGLILKFVFGVWLHVLPTSGTASLGVSLSPIGAFFDHLKYLILPMLTLAALSIAGWSRYMRSSTIEVIKQDYMRTARAKGVGPVAVLFRHALRNAVIPLITVVAIDFGAVAGGADAAKPHVLPDSPVVDQAQVLVDHRQSRGPGLKRLDRQRERAAVHRDGPA